MTGVLLKVKQSSLLGHLLQILGEPSFPSFGVIPGGATSAQTVDGQEELGTGRGDLGVRVYVR